MFGWHHHSNWGPWDGFGIWPLALSSLVVGLVLSLLAAYALMTRQPWGRVIGIICGILALVHPVLGTALGIYTLWVLAPSASGYEYAEISARHVRV
jgi:ABC-type spermidine/putrescine transport system permease subunit II